MATIGKRFIEEQPTPQFPDDMDYLNPYTEEQVSKNHAGMNADEARHLSDKTLLAGIDDVYITIEKEARKGEYRTLYYSSLTYPVILKLRENGFGVTDAAESEGPKYIISWDRKKEENAE